MDMKNENGRGFGSRLRTLQLGTVLLVILSVFFIVKTVNEVKKSRTADRGVITDTISVNGKGEVYAIPDIATFSFTVTETGKRVSDAEKKATEKINKVLAYLRGQKIEDKDLQTTGYNIYPRYDYIPEPCSPYSCPPGRSVLSGYDVSQSVTVKVRDISKAGDLLSGIGALDVQNVSGLTFTADKETDLRKQARALAIEDAGKDAKALAKALGVSLVRIVSYNESVSEPMPIYAMKDGAYGRGGAGGGGGGPEIPVGENKIVSNVNIVYEIR